MTDDEKGKLPAVVQNSNATARDQKERSDVARGVRDPISGWLFGLGSRAHTRSVELDTREKVAVKGNIEAQNDVIKAMMGLQDTVREYDARQTNHNALQAAANAKVRDSIDSTYDSIDENQHQREVRKIHRERELREAERARLNAEQGLRKQERIAPSLYGIWRAEAEADHLQAQQTLEQVRRHGNGADNSAAAEEKEDINDLKRALQDALGRGHQDEADQLEERIHRIESAGETAIEKTAYSGMLTAGYTDAEKLMRAGKLQEARKLLESLQPIQEKHDAEIRMRRLERDNPDH